MRFKQLVDLVSEDKAVLLETSALLNYTAFGDPKPIEKQIETSQTRIDFYRFLRRNLPELTNWYITAQSIEETNAKKGYPYKKIIQRRDSFNHRYNIIIPLDEKRQELEYFRKRRQEKKEVKKLMDTIEAENRVLSLNPKEQRLAGYLDNHYSKLKKEIGVEALSDCDWDFMISGLAIAKANRGNVSLISNDSVMIPLWKYVLKSEHLNSYNFKFILRRDFLNFVKL